MNFQFFLVVLALEQPRDPREAVETCVKAQDLVDAILLHNRKMDCVQDGPDRYPTDWSHDGKYVLYERATASWFLTLPEFKANVFLKAASTPKVGRFSPGGKWVA